MYLEKSSHEGFVVNSVRFFILCYLIKRGLLGLTPRALRMVSASIFLLPVALRRLDRVRKGQFIFLASIGFLGSLISGFLFAVAQVKIESGIVGVVNAMTLIFTILIGLVIYKQKHPISIFIGVIIGFIGTAMLVLADPENGLGFNYYTLFVVLATACYGFNINIIKHHLNKLQALTVTAISLLIAGPFALFYLIFFTDFFANVMSFPEVQVAAGYTALLGILSTAIALSLFNKLVQITDPIFASSVTYLIPIVALFGG